MRFVLRGTGGNQPHVTGTGAIAPLQYGQGIFYTDLAADASGNVSGTVYSTRDAAGTGNGEIELGGSLTAAYFGMFIYANGVPGPEVPIHTKNTATIDISSPPAISLPVVVTAPTGDSTYLRIDAANSPVTGSTTFSTGIVTKNLNRIVFADRYTSGANGGAMVNLADAALGSNAGEIWVNSNCNGTWDAVTLSANHTLRFVEGATYSIGNGIALAAGCAIIGCSRDTVILKAQNSSGFNPISATSVDGVRIANVTVDQNNTNTSGNYAILLDRCNHSTVENVYIKNARSCGVMVTGATGVPANDNIIRNNIIDGYGAASLGQAITLFRNANRNLVVGNIIKNPNAGTVGILVDDATSTDTTSLPSNYNIVQSNILLSPIVGIDQEGSDHCKIIDNTVITPTTQGILVQTGNGTGIHVICTNSEIKGNNVVNTTSNADGIVFSGQGLIVSQNVVTGTAGSGRSFLLQSEGSGSASSDIIFSDNISRSPTAGATQPALRVAPTSLSNFRVVGNQLNGSLADAINASGGGNNWVFKDNILDTTNQHGINLAPSAALTNVTIESNTIRNCSTQTANTYDGVNASNGSGSLTRVFIRGNMIVDDRGGSKKMHDGVNVASGTDVQITNNIIVGHTTAQVADSSTGNHYFNTNTLLNGNADTSAVAIYAATVSSSLVVSGGLTTNTEILTAAAPTVSASQVGLGSTHATSVGAAGAATALPANPVGYLIINVEGTAMKIPYYNN